MSSPEEDVRRLLARYCHLMDDRRLEECSELFHRSAVLVVGSDVYTGRVGVLSWLQAVGGSVPRGRHICTNSSIETMGETISSTSDWLFVDFALKPQAMGRYEDRMSRSSDQSTWLIESRTIVFAPKAPSMIQGEGPK